MEWHQLRKGTVLPHPTQILFQKYFLPLVSRYWRYLSLTDFTTVSDITGQGQDDLGSLYQLTAGDDLVLLSEEGKVVQLVI